MRTYLRILFACILTLHLQNLSGQLIIEDIPFGSTSEKELSLDLYLPTNYEDKPLLVWVHGGAWHSGSKQDPPMTLVKRGFPMASISYRRSIEATFPAQIHDIKAAVRFLRANTAGYKYDIDKIILMGSSAGGHLVALAGLSNGDQYLEGNVGNHLDVSSDVQGTIDFYGPTNFETILDQSTPHGINVRAPALALLFGKPLDQVGNIMALASPVNYVDSNDPPIFIAHGDQDYQVPINQSIELYGKCKDRSVKVELEFVHGNGHGGPGFSESTFIDKIIAFIK